MTDLSQYEKKIYSQNGEDGVIEKIFEIIGTKNKHYVEFGVEDDTERNTRTICKTLNVSLGKWCMHYEFKQQSLKSLTLTFRIHHEF